MTIYKDYDLIKLNTFGISVRAKFFVEIENEIHLSELFSSVVFKNSEKLFLGGGSNILFTKDFDGIVILNKLKGIEILNETKDDILIKAMSGEVWNDLVDFSVEHNYWGIENLSLIYGTVGAAPMQNIGAYGVELKDVLEQVEAIEIATGEKKVFTNSECAFGYRDSVFKNKFKGLFFIVSITLKLSKKENINIEYKALKQYVTENNIVIRSIKDISKVVASVRRSKLPDPNVLGNAGSFFKNVFVDEEKFQSLSKDFGDVPHFAENNLIKIPAGWLIEQAGPEKGISWKGYRAGNVGVHEKQALVIVNYGNANGEEIKNLFEQIIASVYAKFGVELMPEVNLI